MKAQTYFLGSGLQVMRAINALKQLTFGPKRGYVITIEAVEPQHTDAQRRKLRAIEGEVAEFTGHDPEEVHEHFLAQRFGLVTLAIGGGTLTRPARRSSDLKRSEMAQYIDWVCAFAAREFGMVIE